MRVGTALLFKYRMIPDLWAKLQAVGPELKIELIPIHSDPDSEASIAQLGVDTFTLCEMDPYVLITQQIYSDIHSDSISIPLETDYTLPYGLIYALEPSPAVRRSISAAERVLQ